MSRRIFIIIIWLLAAGLFNPPRAYAKGDIQWDMQELFEHKSQNEDITKILRQISKRNKMNLVILPGVEGTETFDFVHFPLQGVFNLIITKHDLDYRFDKATNTLTVSNMGDPMLHAGSPVEPVKHKPEFSPSTDVAIKIVERELDEMIRKERLATRLAETQIQQLKELEAKRLDVYRAEANVKRLFQSNSSLQEQIAAAEEAKKEANAYLALQAKHDDELETVRLGIPPIIPELKPGIMKPPPIGAEFRSGKRAASDNGTVEQKLDSKKKLEALEKRFKSLTIKKKKDNIKATRRKKEREEKISELTKTSERLEQQLKEARKQVEASARNQAQQVSKMQEQVSTQKSLQTEAELKDRVAKGILEREQLQLAASLNKANEAIAKIELKSKISDQQHTKQIAALQAERKKIRDSQEVMAGELRLKDKQLAKNELELQTTLKRVRQTQAQASLEAEIKANKKENREKELEAKLEQMRQSQKQTELKFLIDAEKYAKRERELKLNLEKMGHSEEQTRLQSRLLAEKKLKKEQEYQLKLERMRHAQIQAQLKASIEVERSAQREQKLVAKLERQRRAKVLSEMQATRESNLRSRQKAEADGLREIAARKKIEKQKLEAEKLRMITELAAHKKELERLKRKKTTEDKVKLVRKFEPDTRSISTTRFDSLTAAKKPIDATWLFKLTGIGRSGGFMYATVDGKDYKIGDNFGGMTIFKIERNQVFCTKLTKDGPINYIVGFRR